MPRRSRLDAELVRRGLARSRQQAAELVAAGRVLVGGAPATKPATGVLAADAVVLAVAEPDDFVSRGGPKLAGALDAWKPGGPAIAGRRCLDAGASTGGFTDVLLRRGASSAFAVDVGYGQLAWRLRTDPRVCVLDRTNVRYLTPERLAGPVDLTVADLSFISLPLVLPALARCTRSDGDLIVLVKPQFEVGRQRLPRGGVVRAPAERAAAVEAVATAAAELGLGVSGIAASPLPGPAGNVEYFLWLRADAAALDTDALARVVEEGPQ